MRLGTGNTMPLFHLNSWKSHRIFLCFTLAIIGFIFVVIPDKAHAGRNEITVTISPQEASDAGAQWRISYRTYTQSFFWGSWSNWSSWSNWQDSGEQWRSDNFNWRVQSVQIQINFSDIGICTKPDNIYETLDNGDDRDYEGVYTNCSTPTTTTTTTSTTTTSTTTTSTTTTTTSTTTTTTTTTSSTTTTTLPGSVCVDISEAPLDTQLQAAPANIMFLVDDSGSMDWSFMTQDGPGGRMDIGYTTYEYIWPMGDNIYSDYSSYNDDIQGSASARNYWKSQVSAYNSMYYNPQVTYDPWPTYSNASTSAPRSNPNSSSYTLSLSNNFGTIGSATVKNSHYFTWNDSNEDSVVDTGEAVYLVSLSGTSRSYYRFVDSDNDNYVDAGELTAIAESSVPDYVKPKSAAEDLQNFANWFSYYRRRELTAKNAIANVITGLSGVRVGIHGINHSIRQPVLEVNVTQTDGSIIDNTGTLLTQLYNINSSGGTPLRLGLQTIGDYMAGSGSWPYGTQPYCTAVEGGECQQSFAIVMTDGNWNGSSPGVGHQDRNMGDPYEDNYSDTLADVAMKYYKTDLSSGLGNLVPENYPDLATWQHMVTYGLAFGLHGTLYPAEYDFYNSDVDERIYATWPQPNADSDTTIDDLWHASVNGRGEYLSAADPEELTQALELLMLNIESRIGSGASVSINGEEISTDSTIFQSSYSSDGWTGDVKAYGINQLSGDVNATPEWSAKIVLEDQVLTGGWSSSRKIGTCNGTTGVAFRYSALSTTQKAQLSSDQLDYIRGDESLEENQGGTFRNRTYKLGDIVHSVPVYHDGYIFVGGNDGMLHVLEESYGQEVFAYVPNLVFPNLQYLTDPDYEHKFFVDKSPYVKDTGSATLLVSGLGRGGKGYFCLDVTSPSANTESTVGSWVKWEFSDSTDLGYTYSRAFIVNSNDGWVVIFGNGYNSTSGHGVLFILNASTGSLIKKIDVGGTCNGMSTPAIIDVNNDDIVDYVYAGDLNGNMWKFDLTAENSSDWEVAYKSGSTSEPLFTAKGPSGSSQPITTKPDVMRHCVENGYMVLFGTGQYLGDSDFINTDTQTIYGIWDYGDDDDDSEYLGTFNRGSTPQLSNQANSVSLLEQTQIFFGQDPGGSTTYDLRVLSDNEPSWVTVEDINGTGDDADPSNTVNNHVGWFFDLPISKERVVRNVIVRDAKLIVVSSIPKSSPCAAGGDSILHEMDACSGSRLTEAQFDINDDGVIDENDMITIDDPDNPGETITVAPTGIKYPAMIYEPIILTDDDIEMKYFSTAAGNIIMLKEESEKRGMFYWREVR